MCRRDDERCPARYIPAHEGMVIFAPQQSVEVIIGDIVEAVESHVKSPCYGNDYDNINQAGKFGWRDGRRAHEGDKQSEREAG